MILLLIFWETSVQVSLIKIIGRHTKLVLSKTCHENFIWRELIQLMGCWTSEKRKSDDKSVLEKSWQWCRVVKLLCLEEIMCRLTGLRMQKSTISTGMNE